MSNQPRERLTEAEFAKRIGLSVRTLARRRERQQITHRSDGRRIFYLAPDDIDAYYEHAKREPKSRKKATQP